MAKRELQADYTALKMKWARCRPLVYPGKPKLAHLFLIAIGCLDEVRRDIEEFRAWHRKAMTPAIHQETAAMMAVIDEMIPALKRGEVPAICRPVAPRMITVHDLVG